MLLLLLLAGTAVLARAAASAGREQLPLAKILGGVDAQTDEFPYLLSMELWGHHICGATALSPWWAVTAAHCVSELVAGDLVGLRAGSVRREVGGHVHCVVRTVQHPRYGDHWYDHDIALLQAITGVERYLASSCDLSSTAAEPMLSVFSDPKVAKPFPASGYVSFLRVSDVADWPPGTHAIIAGWGVTKIIDNVQAYGADVSFSDRLKKVEVAVVGNEVCRKKPVFFMTYPVTSRMLCAISEDKDSTQGDSGGPLVVVQRDGPALVGIVSWGEGRGYLDSPGVYTRVASFSKWIHTHIKRRRPTRDVGTLRLRTCSASRPLWDGQATHKVRVIPARKRRHRRRRARRPRPALS